MHSCSEGMTAVSCAANASSCRIRTSNSTRLGRGGRRSRGQLPLDHDDLTRYGQTYAFQRFFSQAVWDTVRDNAVLNLSALSLPLCTGSANPIPTLLNSRVRALAIIESQLQQIDGALRGIEPDASAMPALAASAPSH